MHNKRNAENLFNSFFSLNKEDRQKVIQGISLDSENNKIPKFITRYDWLLTIKTNGNFLWRLWFLISAPIIWLIKGEVKIK